LGLSLKMLFSEGLVLFIFCSQNNGTKIVDHYKMVKLSNKTFWFTNEQHVKSKLTSGCWNFLREGSNCGSELLNQGLRR
jgi:hypothetical protein